MSLSNDQVGHIARLARIAVSASELEATRDKLNGIFGLIEQMQAVDTTGVERLRRWVTKNAANVATTSSANVARPTRTTRGPYWVASAPSRTTTSGCRVSSSAPSHGAHASICARDGFSWIRRLPRASQRKCFTALVT